MKKNDRKNRGAQRAPKICHNHTPQNQKDAGLSCSSDRSRPKPCQQCGACCGLIFVSPSELAAIDGYIREHGVIPNTEATITCPFLSGNDSDEVRRCLIYPVRPGICRAFPHSVKMRCPKGACEKLPESVVLEMATGGGMPTTTLNQEYGGANGSRERNDGRFEVMQ